MEELYRYLVIRPTEAIDEDLNAQDIADLTVNDSFQVSINKASDAAKRAKLATNFISSNKAFKDAKEIKFSKPLIRLAEHYMNVPINEKHALDEVLETTGYLLSKEGIEPLNPPEGRPDVVQNHLNELVHSSQWKNTYQKLSNTMLAIRESNLMAKEAHLLGKVLLGMVFINKLVDISDEFLRPGALVKSTLYFTDAQPVSRRPNLMDKDKLVPDIQLEKKRKDYIKLAEVTDELINVPVSQINRRPTLRTLEETEERMAYPTPARNGVNERSARLLAANVVTRASDEDGLLVRQVSQNATLSSEGLKRLSSKAQSVLREFNIDPKKETFESLLGTLRSHQQNALETKLYSTPKKMIKGTWVSKNPILESLLDTYIIPDWLTTLVPTTTGNVSPAGIGDLLIVKQHLKRYQGGDIAHIENILAGEEKVREHRRRNVTEITELSETETEISEERETQTTKRYEMALEVAKQLKEEYQVEAGLKVAAQYGPVVKVEANAEFGYKNAKEESRKMANKMSKEVVDKASNKYREKVREQQTLKLIEEIEDKNRHTLNAQGASQHIVGVYQWLNKVYEAQVYNYGLRVMYEFMIPEPAAYYLWSLTQKENEAEDLVVPPTFEISANNINEWNYKELIALYQADDVGPPPEPFVTVSVHKTGGPNPDKGPMVDSDMATIPEGYEYLTYSSSWTYNYKTSDDSHGFSVVVSDAYQSPGTVPIYFNGYSIIGFSAFVHVLCRRTNTAYEKWRQNVFDVLKRAHAQLVAKYEEKLAALSVKAGVQIKGKNPLFNRQLEQTELKKSCLTLLTGSYPSWLNGINETVGGPVINASAAAAQGAYVRFMEQAFEWKNMTYLFYPYFWARKEKWGELMSIEDVDPEFQEFLTSGYARVNVPVRPGFEAAVEHFRQTGQVWSGGKLPEMTDPDYLPIAQEIKEKLDGPSDEEPVGHPWEVVVPTQLVRLRDNNDLPRWEKQPDGNWVEV